MRRWDESRGDKFQSWGPATYFFEVGADGCPIRQMEVYDHGPTLRYGPDNEEDQHGMLAQGQLDSTEDWAPWSITRDVFEKAWSQDG
jgi:hypothetical protein